MNHASPDEISLILEDHVRLGRRELDECERSIRGLTYAAVQIAERCDMWCTDAYIKGVEDGRERAAGADVAKLMAEIDTLKGRLSLERAMRSVAERKFEQAAANAATK